MFKSNSEGRRTTGRGPTTESPRPGPGASLGATVIVVLTMGVILFVAGELAAESEGTALLEGFEGGVMPPAGWTTVVLNLDHTWEITTDSPHAGSFAAQVPRDPQPFDVQNEFLISPELTLVEGVLTFWSRGDLHWCRDVLDNCELFVWLVVGELGGSDDVFLGTADPDWTATDVWSESVIDLTPFLPQPAAPVRIAFNYLGFDDREKVGLDDVRVDDAPPADWIFSDGFESGGTLAWSETVN